MAGTAPPGRSRRTSRASFNNPRLALVVLLATCWSLVGPQVATAAVPSGFVESTVFSGLVNPTAVRFSPDGRVFIAEKSGIIKVYSSISATTPTVFADLRTNVQDFWDRGLLGLALDPGFPAQPYVYVLYTHDAAIGGVAPRWGDTCPSPPGATTDGCMVSARLSRLTASGSVMTGSEQVLIEDWCQQFPSHSIGDLRFGPDGSLYVSGGDGASFNYTDYGQSGGSSGSPTPKNPCGDPPGGVGGAMAPPTAEGGALRSQDLRTPAGSGVSSSQTYAQLIGGLSPIAYWRLGESSGTLAADTAGANPGTYAGGVTLGVPGLLTGDSNTAVFLDGTTGQVQMSSSAALNPTNAMSIAGWMNASTWTSRNPRIVQKGITDNQYRLLAEFGSLKFDITGVGAVTAALPSLNTRHFVVGTYDGSALCLYVDGTLVGQTAATAAIPTSTDPLAIGNKPTSVDARDPFPGVLDDVSVHGRALTATEVGQLWTVGATGPGGTLPPDPTTLDGAILRVNPSTGAGAAGNPLAGSSDANERRIVAYGFRNPYRFAFRPGTNEIWVGDVGWNTWEEVDRIQNPTAGPTNFGWPCYEGAGRQSSYESLGLSICTNLYGESGAHTGPYYAYNHSAQVVAGESCPTGSSSITGMAFYQGGSYPAAYAGALFFADYSRDCIWAMRAGTNGLPDPAQIETFVAGAANPVSLEIGPGGDLFYVDLTGGTIRRISYIQAGQAPTAVVQASPTSGTAPLTVSFDGSGSSDPQGGALTYAWDFTNDGTTDSTSVAPSFIYQQAGAYTAKLTVTDAQSLTATDTVTITVSTSSNSPPVPTIATPTSATTWAVGDVISFSGSATDPEEGALPASRLSWALVLQHCPSNCHAHLLQTWTGVGSGSFSAPDHEYPSYLELTLTATDSQGLSASKTVRLDPKTVQITMAAQPPGLQLTIGALTQAAPFTVTVIQGSSNSISAPTPQDLAGTRYVFSVWSDGGAQSHNITAGTSNATYTATYNAVSADLRIVKTAVRTAGSTTITYTLVITNLGPGSAASVSVTDVLTSRLAYVSSSTPQGSCSYASGSRTLSCILGSLANQQTVAITLVTVVNKLTGSVSNTASVTSTTPDLNTGNSTSSVNLKLHP